MAAFLIADDSEGKRLMLQGFLKHMHWAGEIFTANTTEEAKRVIQAHPEIGFAFVDYEMPTEQGPAVIAALKKSNPKARIALVSSSDSKHYEDDAKAAGAEACICTSYESDLVEKTLKELLESWKESA